MTVFKGLRANYDLFQGFQGRLFDFQAFQGFQGFPGPLATLSKRKQKVIQKVRNKY